MSSGPKRLLKTKIFVKKAIFTVKRLWPTSSRIIEHNKCQETAYKVPQGNMTINVNVKRSFLQEPRDCWKHKLLKKKATFPVKKRFSPIFSRIIEQGERQKTTYKGPQGNMTINVEVIRPFLQDPRGCWKHRILKKRQSFQWKDFGPFFLALSSLINLKGRFIRGEDGLWQILLEL